MGFRLMCLLVSALAICAQTPEHRAIDYLTVEVPRWSRENGCFSCHNNGDAARALFAARDRGMKVPREALADTLGWLSRPAAWQAPHVTIPPADGRRMVGQVLGWVRASGAREAPAALPGAVHQHADELQ